MLKIEWKKTHEDAIIPKKQNTGDGCFDINCIESGIIFPKCSKIIRTGLSMQIKENDELLNEGWILRAYPRSGLGFKKDILIHIGTIDSGYRNEIMVKLFNFSFKFFVFNKGDRLIQMAIEKVHNVEHSEVFELNINNDRGFKGFGSSGR